MYSVYLIKNWNKQIYIGYTINLEQRLISHNNPDNKGWTNKKWPWTLIHVEVFDTQSEALKREKSLKNLKAWSRIKEILSIPR